MTKNFLVERAGLDGWQPCTVRVRVKQQNNRWTISRRCAEKPAFRIRKDDDDWGVTLCALHARLRIEELQTELLAAAEPEKEEQAAS